FVHSVYLLVLSLRARVVYMHSIYSAIRLPWPYFCSSVITDLHGVVPEELEMQGRMLKSRMFGLVEAIAAKRSLGLIYVTEAMARHFKAKYSLVKRSSEWVIPIFSEARSLPVAQRERDLVIYSGGLQIWQCIDAMLELIASRIGEFKYLILTNSEDCIKRRLKARGIRGRVQVRRVPKSEVYGYYV